MHSMSCLIAEKLLIKNPFYSNKIANERKAFMYLESDLTSSYRTNLINNPIVSSSGGQPAGLSDKAEKFVKQPQPVIIKGSATLSAPCLIRECHPTRDYQ